MFVLDGVLIGAGDARYLALAGVVNLVAYVPLLVLVGRADLTGGEGIVWLWLAFGVGYMLAGAGTLAWRVRDDRWMVTGATRGRAARSSATLNKGMGASIGPSHSRLT